MFLAHDIVLSPHRIIFNEISTICKWGCYVETCFMRSNVKAVKIQCKRAPNTSSGKFQRGPAAVKISRYMHHHSLRTLRNQQERWWGKEGDDDDDHLCIDGDGDDDHDYEEKTAMIRGSLDCAIHFAVISRIGRGPSFRKIWKIKINGENWKKLVKERAITITIIWSQSRLVGKRAGP